MKRLLTSLVILNLALLSGLAFGASSYEEGVADLSKAIVADAAKFKKQKLAVVDFTDLSGNVTELGRFLAEELSVSLVITGAGLEIVDRTQLNKIFREQALSFSGVLDPAAVKKVGQLAGVDALIAGTITDLEDTIRLTLKIIATDTGSLVSAARTAIPKTGTIAKLMAREVAPPRAPGPDRPETERAPSLQPSPPPTTPRSESSTPYFQNSFLRVTHKSVSKSKDKKHVNLALQFENVSKENVYISLRSDNYNPIGKAGLTDDKGSFFPLSKLNGLSLAHSDQSHQKSIEHYAILTPGASHTVVMFFESGQESEGSAFSFSADLFRYVIEDEKEKGILSSFQSVLQT